MSCPPELLKKIAMHRESLLAGEPVQEWIGRWWVSMMVDERRTLLAFAGLDDSLQNARRPWSQYLYQDRITLLTECKRLFRMVEAVRWA